MHRLAGVASLLVLLAVGSAAPPVGHRLHADELRDLLVDSMTNPQPMADDLDPDTEAATTPPGAKSITTLIRDSAPPEATLHDQTGVVIWAS